MPTRAPSIAARRALADDPAVDPAGAIAGLPTLGVGLSLSFGVEPDPVALAARPGGPSFIEYAGAVQHQAYAAQVSRLHALGVPVLYHPSCLNLCGPWPNPPSWLAAVDAHLRAVDSAWLAQDVAVCFVGEHGGYSIDLGWFVPPILDPEGLELAVQRVQEVQAVVGRPLLLEPAPVTFQVGSMDPFTWLGRLAAQTGCGVLLDAGHVLSHQLARGEVDLLAGIEAVGLDRVIEVHVAGGVIEGPARGPRRYLDAHDLPILPETWKLFEGLLERCPNLRAVCLECEGAAGHTVLPVLRRVREVVAARAANPDLRARALQELSP